MHPLLRIIGTDPHLLLDHAEAYAALISADAGSTVREWTLRIAWVAAAFLCVFVSVILLGVAVMLWTVTPGGTSHTAAVLGGVALAPLCPAVVCAVAARAQSSTQRFENLQRQLQADLQMLREINT